MQSVARIAVSIFLLTSALASAYQGSAKLRRDGVLNLYPFPRVGRSSHNTWDFSPRDEVYNDYKLPQKRQLYAFPRVGRGDQFIQTEPLPSSLRLEEMLMNRQRSHGFAKRESESADGPGMWFGPRLGRMFKDSDEDEVQINSDHSEPEQLEMAHNEERRKRQTKLI